MGYTSMTVGNHEFNFGQAVLNKIRGEMTFPDAAANCRFTSTTLVFLPTLFRTSAAYRWGSSV